MRFVVDKPTNSEGVFVKFVGKAEVHWTESESRGEMFLIVSLSD